MTPAAGVHAFSLDGGTALFSERTGRLHLLNETAGLLWQGLTRREHARAIAQRAARRYGVPVARVRRDFADALAEFRRQGLLGGAPPTAQPPIPTPLPEATASPSPAAREVRRYRIAGATLAVATTAATWPVVEAVCGHLRAARVRDAAARFELEICPVRTRFTLNVNGFEHLRAGSAARLQGVLVRVLAAAACAMPGWLAVLHAGAVARDGRCVLFPARGGSGKTTLVAALMHAGCAMLGDDLVALDGTTLRLRALPLPLRIKRGSWDVVGRWYPALRDAPVQVEGERRIRLLRPRVPGRDAWNRGHEVTCLVTPAYRAGAVARLSRCSAFDMLSLLGADAWLHAPCGADRVGRLIEWVRTKPAYRLEYGDVDDAVALLGRRSCP